MTDRQALPTILTTEHFTLQESSVENLLYGQAMNRIRFCYGQVAGSEARGAAAAVRSAFAHFRWQQRDRRKARDKAGAMFTSPSPM